MCLSIRLFFSLGIRLLCSLGLLELFRLCLLLLLQQSLQLLSQPLRLLRLQRVRLLRQLCIRGLLIRLGVLLRHQRCLHLLLQVLSIHLLRRLRYRLDVRRLYGLRLRLCLLLRRFRGRRKGHFSRGFHGFAQCITKISGFLIQNPEIPAQRTQQTNGKNRQQRIDRKEAEAAFHEIRRPLINILRRQGLLRRGGELDPGGADLHPPLDIFAVVDMAPVESKSHEQVKHHQLFRGIGIVQTVRQQVEKLFVAGQLVVVPGDFRPLVPEREMSFLDGIVDEEYQRLFDLLEFPFQATVIFDLFADPDQVLPQRMIDDLHVQRDSAAGIIPVFAERPDQRATKLFQLSHFAVSPCSESVMNRLASRSGKTDRAQSRMTVWSSRIIRQNGADASPRSSRNQTVSGRAGK